MAFGICVSERSYEIILCQGLACVATLLNHVSTWRMVKLKKRHPSCSPTSPAACSSPHPACAATAAELHEAAALPRTPKAHSQPADARNPLRTFRSPPSARRVGLLAVLRPLKHWEARRKQQLSESAPTRWERNPSPGWTVANGQQRLKSPRSLATYALVPPTPRWCPQREPGCPRPCPDGMWQALPHPPEGEGAWAQEPLELPPWWRDGAAGPERCPGHCPRIAWHLWLSVCPESGTWFPCIPASSSGCAGSSPGDLSSARPARRCGSTCDVQKENNLDLLFIWSVSLKSL